MMTAPVGVPLWMGDIRQILPMDEELQAINGHRERENQFSPGMDLLMGFSG